MSATKEFHHDAITTDTHRDYYEEVQETPDYDRPALYMADWGPEIGISFVATAPPITEPVTPTECQGFDLPLSTARKLVWDQEKVGKINVATEEQIRAMVEEGDSYNLSKLIMDLAWEVDKAERDTAAAKGLTDTYRTMLTQTLRERKAA